MAAQDAQERIQEFSELLNGFAQFANAVGPLMEAGFLNPEAAKALFTSFVENAEPDYEVEHYLQHQGHTFLDRFDALSYLYLTRLLDYFDPFAEPSSLPRLRESGTRFQLTSFDSDWRFSTAHSVRLAESLSGVGVWVDHAEIPSPWGHDSFLLQPPGYHERVAAFLR